MSRRLFSESSGMLRKTTTKYPLISVKVDFSEEERAVIKAWKLEERIVIDRELQPGDHDVSEGEPNFYAIRIRHLLLDHPTETKFQSPDEALAFESQIKELLITLKHFITANASFVDNTETFEL